MGNAGGAAPGKAADMHFIDNQIPQGELRTAHIAPVKAFGNHPCVILVIVCGIFAPFMLTGDGSCVRIQQDPFLVEQQSLPGIVGAVHPVGVLKFRNIQPEHDNGEHISDPVGSRNGDHCIGGLFLPVKQQQLTAGGVGGRNGKVDCIGHCGCPLDQVIARTYRKTADGIHGDQGHVCNDCHGYLPSLIDIPFYYKRIPEKMQAAGISACGWGKSVL